MAIYVDHAAATPIDPKVVAAMKPYFSDDFYNPSALYQAARDIRKSIEAARADVAAVIGSRPSEIIFTAGGTESCNLAIHGVLHNYPTGNIVTTAIEHEAVLAPAHGYQYTEVAVNDQGIVDVTAIMAAVDDNTVLISVMYGNNEVGSVQPLAAIGRAIVTVRDKRRRAGNQTPLYFHTDACQAAGILDIHISRLGVDLMSLNGGKIYGPKQSGVLYVRGGIVLHALVQGGGQERGLRSGTENPAACIGFAAALQLAEQKRNDEVRRLSELRDHFMRRIGIELPEVQINGSRRHRLAGNVHITIPGSDNERLLIELDQRGIQAAAGSACTASNDTPSHVLRAMGLSDREAQASLRFTLGRTTTLHDVDTVVDTLRLLVAQ